ncbi:hypothetical protein JCM11251_002212 [Rhodosporidiobolus azoricus]
MSTPLTPPESPFEPRPAPPTTTTTPSSDEPSSRSTGPTSVKPMPIEWPLTSFASTPHNVACIGFALGACWATGLAFAFPSLTSWFTWSASSVAKLPTQGWWTSLTADPQLGMYLASWAVFHLFEFVVTSMWNPGKLSVDSYLLNNGVHYDVAHAAGILEHILEERYFSEEWRRWKHSGWVFASGLLVLAAGQFLRSFAMISASSNFSHLKRPDHELVKTGIYAWSRHPSYAGFYWWAVGTQLVLGNPFCTLVFVATLHWFFSARITVEERYLIKFFGKDYEDYRARVPSRILFIP